MALTPTWPVNEMPWRLGPTAEVVARVPLPILLAFSLELLLLATHAKVLFAVGKPYSYEELKGRRAYFVVDLLSPWASLAVARQWLTTGSIPAGLYLLVTLHSLLHVYYIATWNTPHTERVIHLSSDDTCRRQAGKYGAAELAWFHAGTLFDMATHFVLIMLLALGMRPLPASGMSTCNKEA